MPPSKIDKMLKENSERSLFVELVRDIKVGESLIRMEDCVRCQLPTLHKFTLTSDQPRPGAEKARLRHWTVQCLRHVRSDRDASSPSLE